MPPTPGAERNDSPRMLARLAMASSVAGLTAVCVGLAVFLGGWIGHISFLRTILPGAQSMKANTALGLVFLGAALCLNGRRDAGRNPPRLALIFSGLATLIGALTTLEYATRLNFHIDELLVRDYAWTVFSIAPGRMAVTTAISLALLGCALLFPSNAAQRS